MSGKVMSLAAIQLDANMPTTRREFCLSAAGLIAGAVPITYSAVLPASSRDFLLTLKCPLHAVDTYPFVKPEIGIVGIGPLGNACLDHFSANDCVARRSPMNWHGSTSLADQFDLVIVIGTRLDLARRARYFRSVWDGSDSPAVAFALDGLPQNRASRGYDWRDNFDKTVGLGRTDSMEQLKDHVLYAAIGVFGPLLAPGQIGTDFADIRVLMTSDGDMSVIHCRGTGPDNSRQAIEQLGSALKSKTAKAGGSHHTMTTVVASSDDMMIRSLGETSAMLCDHIDRDSAITFTDTTGLKPGLPQTDILMFWGETPEGRRRENAASL